MLFVREVFGAEPDQWQIDLMEAVVAGERQISVRSGHGVGKTTVLAWLVCWHILTKFPQKTVCTAPTSAQLFDALAAEVQSWCNKLPLTIQKLIDVKTDRVELIAAPKESFVSFRTSRPETPEALAGIHSENVLLIGDEGSGIPEQVYEAASGSMSGHNATTILAGNPIRTSGYFFETFHKDRSNWKLFHVNCHNCIRVSKKFIDGIKNKYGEDSNVYRVRVLGEFPNADDDTIIPFELMEASLRRDVAPINVKPIWGVDCARFGSDRSALAKRQGNVLLEKVTMYNQLDTMALVGRIKAEWDMLAPSKRPEDICVDVIGIGAGVVDRLRELNLPAHGINVSESPAMGKHAHRLKDELWWKAREWFIKRDSNIAGDETLGGELTAVKYKYNSSGKLQIETKAEMKKRGLRSPDTADAFVLTFAKNAVTANGSAQNSSWKTPLHRALRGLV